MLLTHIVAMEWRAPLFAMIGFAVATTGLGFAQAPASINPAPAAQLTHPDVVPLRSRKTPAAHVLERADDGLFYLVAHVDDVPVRFVVDTGANVTVLSPTDARRVSWRHDQLAGTANLATAGGTSAMRWARVDTLKIAGHVMTDVDAALPQSGMSTSLLGQNVLSQLGSVTQRGDRLVIE